MTVYYYDVNKKATWQLLPICPQCGHKETYNKFIKNIKGLFEHDRYSESYWEENPRYTITHCNTTIFVELEVHDFKQRVRNMPYNGQISMIAEDMFEPHEFSRIMWASPQGYKIINQMSDDYKGTSFSV